MITEKQRIARTEGIGSSDAAAILGFSPWSNAADVRLKKLGLVEDEPTSELAEIGNALEDGVAALASKRLGLRLVKPSATFVHPDHDCLRANVDRQVDRFARGQPIAEVKDSGMDADWGEPGTDQIPAYVTVQVVHQMLCADADEAHVARLGRGFNRGLFLFHLTRTDDVKRLMDAMLKVLPAWWERHVVNGDPLPDDQPPPSLDLLRRIRREPATTVVLPGPLVLDWRRAEEDRRAAAERADQAKARVLAALGTAEGGTSEHGTVTFLEQSTKSYTVEARTNRVMRFKAAK